MIDSHHPSLWRWLKSIHWYRVNLYFFLGIFIFIAGWMYYMWGNPNNVLYRAHEAAISYLVQYIGYDQTEDLTPITNQKTGILYKERRNTPGYVLMPQTHGFSAKLIDKKGREVHQWSLNPNDLKGCQSCIKPAYFRATHLHENGDLIALIINSNTTPWGGPLVKMDKDSRIQWIFDAHCHHDFAEDPNGNFYVLTHHFTQHKRNPKDPLNELSYHYAYNLPYLDDQVVKLNTEGEMVESFSLIEALDRSSYRTIIPSLYKRGKVLRNRITAFDPLHPNSIQYITSTLAKTQPWLHTGNLAINIKHLGVVFILDTKAKKVTHVIPGPWYLAHHAQILPNGHLSIFDNLSRWPRSRTLEFNPNTNEVLWWFSQDKRLTQLTALSSLDRGGQQWLPNGHFLITDSRAGRLIEINKKKQIVWAYKTSTVMEINHKRYHPFLGRSQLFSPNQLPFLKTHA